jgi:integration host factor subunit alpha
MVEVSGLTICKGWLFTLLGGLGRTTPVTKADIARIVYERHGGISNREAARLVEIILESIKHRLGQGEKVQITGFGTFVVRQKRERRGRNPQTGEEMVIRPRRSVAFRPSKLFGSAAG